MQAQVQAINKLTEVRHLLWVGSRETKNAQFLRVRSFISEVRREERHVPSPHPVWLAAEVFVGRMCIDWESLGPIYKKL